MGKIHTTPLVLVDGGCGFCNRAASFLTGSVVAARVEVVPLQRAPLADFGLTVDKCLEALHVVDGNRVYVGGGAIAHVLSYGRWPWRVLGAVLRLPGVAWVTARVYDAVARNRHRLPGGSTACRLD